MAALNDKMAALATMSLAQLRGEWLQLFKAAAPDAVGRPFLMLGLAHRMQSKAFGGLPVATSRELNRLGRRLEESGDLGQDPSSHLKLGTRLVREWKGQAHQVELTERGYLYRDQQYTSLSQIARAITGAQWSGPRFFGLKHASGSARGKANG